MSVSAAALRKLASLQLNPEQMAGVLDVLADMEAADEARREKQRDRTRRHRDKERDGNVTETLLTRDRNSDPPPNKERFHTSKETNPPPVSLSGSARALKAEFEGEFWGRYPNKVGKPKALEAFVKARQRVELGPMLEALDAYAAKTDDRAWLNPATWLNQDRWTDQPAMAPTARGTGPPANGRSANHFATLAARNHGMFDEPDRPTEDQFPGTTIELRAARSAHRQ